MNLKDAVTLATCLVFSPPVPSFRIVQLASGREIVLVHAARDQQTTFAYEPEDFITWAERHDHDAAHRACVWLDMADHCVPICDTSVSRELIEQHGETIADGSLDPVYDHGVVLERRRARSFVRKEFGDVLRLIGLDHKRYWCRYLTAKGVREFWMLMPDESHSIYFTIDRRPGRLSRTVEVQHTRPDIRHECPAKYPRSLRHTYSTSGRGWRQRFASFLEQALSSPCE